MPEQFTQLIVVFLIQFLEIFLNLVYWCLIIWVVLSWVVVFRGMRPDNPGYILFAQIVAPILKPFRWARVGMLDLSVIVAIVAISFLQQYATDILYRFL